MAIHGPSPRQLDRIPGKGLRQRCLERLDIGHAGGLQHSGLGTQALHIALGLGVWICWLRWRSSEKFTVRTHASQSKRVGICCAVNQQQVWFDVTLTIAYPSSTQRVISAWFRQCMVFQQQSQNGDQQCIRILAMVRRRNDLLVITFKGRCTFNRPHSGPPSMRLCC